MVARAQSSDFAIFMRKIGYSVGLEKTLSRLGDFARLYGSRDTLSLGDIKRLLHSEAPHGWGLKAQNEHILDFFRSLDVVTVRGGDIGILELGEALGILWNLQDEHAFQNTLRFLFAHALVVADGDIFLNALAARFDEVEFAKAASRLIEHKWSVLELVFHTPQQRALIYKAINIEVQENNPGSRGHAGSRVGPLGNRLAKKAGPLAAGDVARPEIHISSNYLAKALGRRRAWAISLGLFSDETGMTPLGENFLNRLVAVGFCGPNCMATWPLSHELAVPLFMSLPLPDDVPRLSSWDLLLAVGRGMALLGDQLREASPKEMDQLLTVMKTFHSLNLSKAMVRNELAIRIAYRCLLALSIGDEAVPDYPHMIDDEQLRPSPRIIARASRVAELALSGGR